MPRPGGYQGPGRGPGSSADNYRVGRRIRVPEVRVIGGDGSQVGILPTHEALRMAEDQGLDLVEVSPRAVPPVCRIMDFGRFKYQESKKEKASRKHQATVVIKEIKFRPKTDTHDMDFKLKHIRRFLGEGNKVRLMIVFRGREIVHPETGQAVLDVVSKEVSEVSVVEQKPSLEGRRMVMVLGPRTGVIRPAPTSQVSSSRPASLSTNSSAPEGQGVERPKA